jgi:hypothetical protein
MIFFIAMCSLLFKPSACLGGQHKIISNIERYLASTLPIYIGKGNRCSSVRISESLILSAAHCFLGYDGQEDIRKSYPVYIKINGIRHDMKIMEIGQFKPKNGKMEDWVLLEPLEDKTILSPISIATLPDRKELENILNHLGGYNGINKGADVIAVTYPSQLFRVYPRKAHDGEEKPFISEGRLKTDDAYKKFILLSALKSQICDELKNNKCPTLMVDIGTEWDKLKKRNIFEPIYDFHSKYKDNGNPILYHTADYSNGSSGGGLFAKDYGFIGIIPIGTSVVPRVNSFAGIGQLYRIDVICRQSNILSQLESCQKLR